MDENQELENNQEEKSQIEDIFGSQIDKKSDNHSDIKKSIMEKVENDYTPPKKEEIRQEVKKVPKEKQLTPQQKQAMEQGDAGLNNIYNGFFKTQQTKSIADVKVEEGAKAMPSDAYKDQTYEEMRKDITKISTDTNEITENKPPKAQLKESINIKPGDGDLEIRTPEEERIVIRENEESIEKFEKKEEEKEKEEYEKEVKKQEELLKNLEKDINSEMTTSQIEDENIDEYRIRSNIDGEEFKPEKHEDDDENKEKEYIGGSKEKSLFVHLASEWGKRMVANPISKIPEKIVGRDYIMTGSEKDVIDFVKQKNRFTLNAQTKVVLPFSGLTLYVNSYTGSTLINLFNKYTRWRAQFEYARQNNTDEQFNQMVSESYYKLRELELKSIYEHVSSIKIAGENEVIEKPSEEDFFKMVKYPDLDTLYFAVFHSTNKTKRKKYTVTCNQNVYDEKIKGMTTCPNEIDIALYDEELVFTIENPHITKEEFYQMIRDEYPKGKVLGTTRIARMEIERLTETKTNITQHVPSLWDYLETLSIINEIILEDQNNIFSYDVSLIDAYIPPEEWNHQKWDRAKLLKSYLYVKKIDFLYPTGEKELEYRTISIDNTQNSYQKRKLIFDILNSFSLDDTYLLTKGEQIKDLMTLKVLDYYIPSLQCPRCKSQLKPIKFDIRMNFFTRISEAKARQNQA